MPLGRYKDLLRSRGFEALLWTQWLGAFNDSVFKIVVTLLAAAAVSDGSGSRELALVGAVFILPFFLFSGYAGRLADAHNKRTVLIATKAIEIFSMLLAVWALWIGSLPFLLAVLFLMASQSTLFSPAKYGIVPEMVPDKDLSRANALIQMTTHLAIILGAWIGSETLAAWPENSWWIGVALTVIAVAGFALSFGIPRALEPAGRKGFGFNPWGEIVHGLQSLHRDKPLWLTVLGISYFWMLGALLQLDIVLFTRDVLQAGQEWNGRLIACLGLGIAAGSLAAGRLSGDKVELGLAPLGSIGMGLAGLGLATGDSFLRAGLFLALLGFAGGLFIVPLNSILQQRSGAGERGRLIAANNFLNMFGVLAASGALYGLHDGLAVGPDRIIFVFAVVTFAVTAYMLTVIPDFLIRFVLWMLTHTVYRIRIAGQENVPFRGPALLVSNHLSYIDGFLIGACVQRFLRFLIYRPYYEMKAFHWILRRMHAIPIRGGDPEKAEKSIEAACEQLRQGHVVCIFAEGSVTRTGNMLPFKPGFERIMGGLAGEGLAVPIIPVNLDRVWGSLFSMKDNKAFFRLPERLPYPVTVSFGRPLAPTAKTTEVRQAVSELAAHAARRALDRRDSLQRRLIRTAKRHWFRQAVADERRSLSYGKLLSEGLLWGRQIRRLARGFQPTQPRVGIALPPSANAVLANLAIAFSGGVAVNLPPDMSAASPGGAATPLRLDGLITADHAADSRLPPAKWRTTVQDLQSSAPGWKVVLQWLGAFRTPARILQSLACAPAAADDPAAILFTAGTGGRLKSVVLSHANIMANVEALAQVFWVKRDDRVMGVLPFSRGLGFTGTLWFPMLTGCGAVYADDPIDGPAIGRLARAARATIIVAAPWMYERYVEQIPPNDLAALRCALMGGDFPPDGLAAAFEEKFGRPLIEGYGLAEMTAVVALNVPDYIQGHRRQTGTKPGTVGHPLPGLAAKIVDPATRERVSPGQPGELWVKGPSRMLGYADDPAATQAVFDGGWLQTGDAALLDGDGFLRIIAPDRAGRPGDALDETKAC